jgi:CDGSH-type Zn-finger protein
MVICTDPDGQCHGWRESKKFSLQDCYALCRCGHSKHKPFCDSTHMQIKFDGTETASRTSYLKSAEKTEGGGLTLTDCESLCIGAGFCQRTPGAWKLAMACAEPSARRQLIEEVGDCPSGRLVLWNKDGKAIEPDLAPSIALIKDPVGKKGPLWVRGGIPIESEDGTRYETRNRVTLCRCGGSGNKPLCDGSHQHTKW